MVRGNNSNTAASPFLDHRFQYSTADESNQQQLCRNSVEFLADPVNYLGNNHGVPLPPPNKFASDSEAIPRQNLQLSFHNNMFHNETHRKANNQNSVSTGLRLSYEDDQKNSSSSSASRSMTVTSSIFSSLKNDMRRELDQHKQELSHLIRSQEETMLRGLRGIKQRQAASFLTTLQKDVAKKLHKKDLELETLTRENKELVDNIKQATTDVQRWCYLARYKESVVNLLKSDLQQAMQRCSNRGKEEIGENDIDDAISCSDPNTRLVKNSKVCRSCKVKEVSFLLMPCRHLCLCKECEAFVSVCPVCQMVTTASFEVYLS